MCGETSTAHLPEISILLLAPPVILNENDFHFHLNGVIVGCAFKHVKGFLRISLSGER